MPAEGTATLGRNGTRPGVAVPVLTSVRIADDRDVEPLLRRATADLSALTLRLGATTHRADAAGPPTGVTLENEAAELRRQIEQELVEHLRLLDVELDQARADAADVIDSASAVADETVRAASIELDVAVATSSGSPTPRPIETPVEGVAPLVVVVAPDVVVVPDVVEPVIVTSVDVVAPSNVVAGPAVVDEQPGRSFVKRVLRPGVVLPLVAVAIVLILLFAWVG